MRLLMGIICCLFLFQPLLFGEKKRGVLSISGQSSYDMDRLVEEESSPFDEDVKPQGFSNAGSTKPVIKAELPTLNETLTTSDAKGAETKADRFSKIGVRSKQVSKRSRRKKSRRMSFSQMVLRVESK